MSESFLGGYRILGELGHGAMGVVYQAMDPRIGRAVAIKRIRLEPGATPDQSAVLRQRLVREASAAGQLSHPGIVTVYHLGEEDSDVFIVMEYVAGSSLERVLAANTMDLRAKLDVLRQAADALDFAHRFGVVHRDVKPANILLREDGVVKIADFGIAKMTQQMTMAGNLTTAGSSLGSPGYMSPEQVKALQVDGRSDQFSLGVIAFQMLTGRLPFSAETAHALMFQIVAVDPFASDPSGLPPAVIDALQPALAKDPRQRYPSCAAMIQALTAAIEPSNPAAQTAPMPTPQYANQTVAYTQPAPVPSNPPAEAKQSPMIWIALAAVVALLAATGGGYFWWKQRSPADSAAAAEPALVRATRYGQVEDIRKLLAQNVDVNAADSTGTTALMLAAEGTANLANYAPIVSSLLDKGARLDLEDKHGQTALMRAAVAGKLESLRLLLARKADPNHKDSAGSTPLLQAIIYGHADAVVILLSGGAQIELEDSSRTRPLMLAAEGSAYLANNAPLVTTLLNSGAAIDAQDDRGRTALYRASAEGKEKALALLLEKKPNVDLQANDGTTPLLTAVTYGKTGATRLLIQAGANVDATESNGTTALMLAAEGSAYIADGETLLTMLLGAGAKIDTQDQRGATALYRAAAAGKTPAVVVLLDKKANINLKSSDGATPLLEAVTYGKFETASLLLTRGAGVDLADGNGTTPLMIAAEGSAYIPQPEKFVALLLSHKARKDLTDSRGRTALARAEEEHKTAVIELLKAK